MAAMVPRPGESGRDWWANTGHVQATATGKPSFVVNEGDVAQFRASGFVVLRAAFDPAPLSQEVSRILDDAFRSSTDAVALKTGTAGNEFRYVPMMCERTPISLSLLDALAPLAADLLGRSVLPLRAKGTRYFGGTAWHRDTELDVASVGLVCYLEPIGDASGALRVLPGSHRTTPAPLPTGMPIGGAAEVGEPIATEPGDLIAFDEHLFHASAGGIDRRQWRVDFFADPVDHDEEDCVRLLLDGVFAPAWDGGYDFGRYPSFGSHWQRSGRPWIARMRELGVYDRAEAEERAARANRARETT